MAFLRWNMSELTDDQYCLQEFISMGRAFYSLSPPVNFPLKDPLGPSIRSQNTSFLVVVLVNPQVFTFSSRSSFGYDW